MPSTISRNARHKKSRKTNPVANQPQPVSPIRIIGADPNTTMMDVTFDQPVSLNGIPAFRTNISNVATAAVQTTADTVRVTFDGNVNAATSIELPFQDPSIRNASGGYVATLSFVL